MTTNLNRNVQANIKQILNWYSVLNFVLLYEVSGEVYLDINQSPKPHKFDKSDGDLIAKIYPDQLKRIKNNRIIILAHNEPPRVEIINRNVVSKLNNFLKILQDHEHSMISYVVIQGPPSKFRTLIAEKFAGRNFDMILNTFFNIPTAASKLMTYETFGHCVLVPKPEESLGKGEIFFQVI